MVLFEKKKNRTTVFLGQQEMKQTLLNAIEKSLFLLVGLINFDDLATSEELHDKVRCHKRADTKLHKSTTVQDWGGKMKTEKTRRRQDKK